MNDPLLEKLLASRKYRDICPDSMRRIYAECQSRYKKPKDAEKAAREALHGISGSFMTPDEAAFCLRRMRLWAEEGREDAQLARALSCHASTRERLPLARMDALYGRVFAVTGRPSSVLDLACGINPLYLGARGIPTLGVDISGQSAAIINAFHESCGASVSAVCADLLCENTLPKRRFHTALLLKTLPLLERQRAGAGANLLSTLDAQYLVVSFPTRTLGGRDVGMEQNYAAWMDAHLPENRLVAARFTDGNELFYILKREHDETD